MTPLDFLAAVLPSPGHGYYCAAELSTNKKEHRYEEKLEDLTPHIDGWNAASRDIYFALAAFDDSGSREATNARFIKALFIDMDGYESKKDAAAALQKFLDSTGMGALGTPWFVGSGGGLHVYWPLADTLPVATWKPAAENFKRLCKQEGLRIDMTVTADAARVLRVPGTFNHKKKYGTPRPVKFLGAGDTFDFAALSALINEKLKPEYHAKVEAPLQGARPNRKPGATQVKLLQNSVTLFEPIYDRTMAGTGCAQLKAYIDNPKEDGLEPIWRGLLSWTKVCEDGDDWAKWISDLHPYPEQRMRDKLRDIKGPYPCIKFDSENPESG